MKKWYLFLGVCLFLSSCGGEKSNERNEPKPFEFPSVPTMIVIPERANYVACHFWDNFDVSDTVYLSNLSIIDQAFADFLGVLTYADSLHVRKSIMDFLNRIETDTMRMEWLKLSEYYLYEPNSPARNEILFEYFLDWQVKSNKLNELQKMRPRALLTLLRRNQPGTKAEDFDFVDTKGEQLSLYKIKAPYVLIYFYNPGCPKCKEITEILSQYKPLNEMLHKKEIVVLAVADKEIELWKEDVSSMPNDWLITYDQSGRLITEELYDLKATPTIYLLDKEKKVLVKDGTVEQIMNFIGY